MGALISLQRALACYAESIQLLPARRVPLAQALGAVLAEPAFAATDLPRRTQSAVDGYALHSSDISVTDGYALMEGACAAGDAPRTAALPPGSAIRIYTGGILPPGADTVARQEIVRVEGARIYLAERVAAGADVRQRGEEVRTGDVLATPGQALHSGLRAALAMAGVRAVEARVRPRIAVIVTGNEVAAQDTDAGAIDDAEIYDANGPLIEGWLHERGYVDIAVHHVADDYAAIVRALEEAGRTADIVLSTGGVSVGDHDHVPRAAENAGYRCVFWKVAQKPGKPLWFGMRGAVPLIAMPGNPAAVLIGLHVHVACVLSLLQGAQMPAPFWRSGVLDADFTCDAQRDTLLRMRVTYDEAGAPRLARVPRQGSHMLSNLAHADGLAWLPANAGLLPRGSRVRWLMLNQER